MITGKLGFLSIFIVFFTMWLFFVVPTTIWSDMSFFLPKKVLQSCGPCVSRTFWTALLVCCHYMHIISQKRSKIITGKRSSLSKQNAATVALSCTKKLQICLNVNIKAIKEPPPPPPSSSCLTSPSKMHPPSPHQQRDPQKLPNWRAYPPFHKSKSPDT